MSEALDHVLPGSKSVDRVAVEEQKLRSLAREIAMDIIDPAAILKARGITAETFAVIASNERFKRLLREELEVWSGALNTRERVDIKTYAMIEDFLPQAWQYLHSPHFADTAKVSLFQALQKQVGIGQKDGALADPGQKVQITINMSNGHKLAVEHDVTPEGKVIEGEVVERSNP